MNKKSFLNIKKQENRQNSIIVLPRYVGSSVRRNKIKRWLRSFLKKQENKGVLVVFKKRTKIFYKKLSYASFSEAFKQAWQNRR